MTSHSYPRDLTLLERLDLIPANLSLIASAVYAAITGLFRGKNGTKYYKTHINYAVLRRATARFSTRQMHYMNPPSNEVYETFAKQKGFEPQTVKLGHGALGHWIGNKNAKNVLVYYHGGGFAMPLNAAWFHVYSDIMDTVNAGGKDVALFVLTYTLTPHAVYPTQLKQSVEALRYIIRDTGRNPSDVFIGGDSAGGNLTFAVLSHLSHPHEAIEPLPLSEPLGGAFAVAPWVSFSQNFPSVKANEYKDMISSRSLVPWGAAYLPDSKGDNYNQPLLAPAEWWKGIKAKDILIVAGGDEVLLGCIEQFIEKLKIAVPNATSVIAQGEAHDAPIVYHMFGVKEETEQGKAIKSWLSARL